jgi:hypothetical protein
MWLETAGALVAAPLAISAVACWRGGNRGWPIALGLALAYAVGHGLTRGAPAWPYAAAPASLVWLAAAGAALGALDDAVAVPVPVRWLLRLGASGLAAIWLGAGATPGALLQATALVALIWTALDLLPEDRFSVAAIAIAAAAGVGVLMLGRAADVGRLQVAVMAAIAGLAVTGWRRAAAPVLGLLVAGAWVVGLRDGEMSSVVATMLFGVPVVATGVRLVCRKAPTFVWVPLMLGGAAMLASSAVMSAVVDYYAGDLGDEVPPVGGDGVAPARPGDRDPGR